MLSVRGCSAGSDAIQDKDEEEEMKEQEGEGKSKLFLKKKGNTSCEMSICHCVD